MLAVLPCCHRTTMKYAVSALLLVVPAASQLYSNATFDVRNTTDVVYAQGTTCANRRDNSSCTAMDLKLDMYQPVGLKDGAPVPALKPAYILMHGGANSAGDKNEYCRARPAISRRAASWRSTSTTGS